MKVPLPQPKGGRVLADWITTSLREAILHGYFEQGEKLDQDLIAGELEVSRMPVREALKTLESEGFVEIRPHRGAFIPQVSSQDIREVYEIRVLLEAEAVLQATPLIPDNVLDELQQSLDEGRAQLAAGHTAHHFLNDLFFHQTIFGYVKNRLMKDVLESLGNRIVRVRRFALLQPGPHLTQSIEEHYCILQAMRQRDAEAAAEAMKTHLERSALRIQQLTH